MHPTALVSADQPNAVAVAHSAAWQPANQQSRSSQQCQPVPLPVEVNNHHTTPPFPPSTVPPPPTLPNFYERPLVFTALALKSGQWPSPTPRPSPPALALLQSATCKPATLCFLLFLHSFSPKAPACSLALAACLSARNRLQGQRHPTFLAGWPCAPHLHFVAHLAAAAFQCTFCCPVH